MRSSNESPNVMLSTVAGNPFNHELIGPSAGHWGRGREEYGRVAFLTTDGGTATRHLVEPGQQKL